MKYIQLLQKWFGAVSTLLILAAALTPDTFRIPNSLRPWIFLGALLWYFIFAAGIFSS